MASCEVIGPHRQHGTPTRASQPKRLVQGFRRQRLLLALLAIVGLYFFYYYMQHPWRPGSMTKLGWNGWYDQGAYLVEALAIRESDLRAVRYQYPMGYPMTAAPFVHVLDDPFLPVNTVSFVVAVGIFFATARRLVGRPLAFVGGLLLALATPVLVLYTAVPWTTTAALVTIGWWGYVALGRRRLDAVGVVIGALLLGWTYMSRGGGELALLAPLGAAVAWRDRKSPRFFVHVSLFAITLILVIAGNVLWTHAIFGQPAHPYVEAVTEVGFELDRIPSSLWGGVVYSGRTGEYWPPLGLSAFWLVFAPFGMYVAIRDAARRDRLVHLGMIISIVLGLVVVASFNAFTADALKFHCLHYMKIWLPVLAVYALVAIRSFIDPRRPSRFPR